MCRTEIVWVRSPPGALCGSHCHFALRIQCAFSAATRDLVVRLLVVACCERLCFSASPKGLADWHCRPGHAADRQACAGSPASIRCSLTFTLFVPVGTKSLFVTTIYFLPQICPTTTPRTRHGAVPRAVRSLSRARDARMRAIPSATATLWPERFCPQPPQSMELRSLPAW